MEVRAISDFRAAMRNGPYAWPGGYPMYFITSDGAALSFAAARAERRNIIEAIADNSRNGWRVVALTINYEDNSMGQWCRCATAEHPFMPVRTSFHRLSRGVRPVASWCSMVQRCDSETSASRFTRDV